MSACPATTVHVVAKRRADARDACKGGQDAFAFFAAHGLGCETPIVLEIVPRLPAQAGPTAVAAYVKRDNQVSMLPYSKFRRIRTWFRVPVDRDLYRSIAAHEVAHALAECNFAIPNATVEAQEYIAYVTMFATMNPRLRERALRAFPGTGFASPRHIVAIIYLFEPMGFGAESYRHYKKDDRGAEFLRSVLAGQALTGSPR